MEIDRINKNTQITLPEEKNSSKSLIKFKKVNINFKNEKREQLKHNLANKTIVKKLIQNNNNTNNNLYKNNNNNTNLFKSKLYDYDKTTISSSKSYNQKLTRLLIASNKKGGLKKYIEKNCGEISKPISLSTLYHEKRASNDSFSIIKKKPSKDYIFEIDIEKLVLNREKLQPEFSRKFNAPELNNMVLFDKKLKDRFKASILLNRYTWNRKKYIVEGKSNSLKAMKKENQKFKQNKEITSLLESDQTVLSNEKALKINRLNRTNRSQSVVVSASNKEQVLLQESKKEENSKQVLRKEFFLDYFIANVLSKKNLTLDQKRLLDGIKEKFEILNGKYKPLNHYYLNNFSINEFNPQKLEIERNLMSNRDTVKSLYVLQMTQDKLKK